uniref:Uncharacterized protein n=1 Tax=Tetranychus urticae TaxID=32264 RepID=T1L4Y3_TETUR
MDVGSKQMKSVEEYKLEQFDQRSDWSDTVRVNQLDYHLRTIYRDKIYHNQSQTD